MSTAFPFYNNISFPKGRLKIEFAKKWSDVYPVLFWNDAIFALRSVSRIREMSVAISPSLNSNKTSGKIKVEGKAKLSIECAPGGDARIIDLYHSDPLRFLFPITRKDEIMNAVTVTTSGGLVGGDVISIEVNIGENARALVMAQAAEKIYRSNGENTEININLLSETGGWLEFLPQETILFEGSRLNRKKNINVIDGGRLFAGEIIVFGRLGFGENFENGLIRDVWEIEHKGRLIWSDVLHLEKNIGSVISDPACFDGAVAMATAVYVGPDAEEALTIARDVIGNSQKAVKSGVTHVNGILVMRWLGNDTLELRNAFGDFWLNFRNKLIGLPARMPRLWNM